MKKKISTILGTVSVAAILAGCCITDKNGDPGAVNYALFAIAALCGVGSKKTETGGRPDEQR